MTTAAQNRAIHAALRKQGLDDALYRDMLWAQFGKRSSSELTDEQATSFLKSLDIPPVHVGSARGRAVRLEGPYAKILQALWIAGYNLGLIHNRDDAALALFVKRQTRLDHSRWLTDAKDASRAIEALRGWLARAGGVEWPVGRDAGSFAQKRAVCRAIAKKLHERQCFGVPGVSFDFAFQAEIAGVSPMRIDDFANRLGQKLRRELAEEKKRRAA
jgi:hypothetical protein